MVLTVIPMALNALACATVWMSELSLLSKIIITVVLVAKFATYFVTALMDSSDRGRSFGLAACIAANAFLVGFFVWKAIWYAILPCVVLIILAIVWGSISGFTFKKED